MTNRTESRRIGVASNDNHAGTLAGDLHPRLDSGPHRGGLQNQFCTFATEELEYSVRKILVLGGSEQIGSHCPSQIKALSGELDHSRTKAKGSTVCQR